MEYLSAIEKNEILLFAAVWMNIKSIMLSKRKLNTAWCHLYMES